MKKFLLVFIGTIIIVLVVFGIGLYWFFSNSSRPAINNNNQQPVSQELPRGNSTAVPSGDRFTIGNGDSAVTVKNFLPSARDRARESILMQTSEGYELTYFTQDKSFLISILKQPFAFYREKAENELLKILDITKAQACQLQVFITVPLSVDETLAGRSYHLSFCSS